MASKPLRIRIEFVWTVVFLICVVLLGFASVRRYRHAAVLLLHLDKLEHRASKATGDTDHLGESSIVQGGDLAARSRAQFAMLLGLLNASGPRIELESEKWKPLVLRHCTEDMLPHYAPCLVNALPNLEYGEEIVYPDFEAALPGFFSRADAELWVRSNYGPDTQGQTGSNKRAIVDARQGRLVFTGLRGQNLAFKDVEFDDNMLPNSWVEDSSHCLGHLTATSMFHNQRHSPPPPLRHQQQGKAQAQDSEPEDISAVAMKKGRRVEEAAVYVTPDNTRYQHWLDHTTKPLMQSAHLITNETRILSGGPMHFKQDIVQKMWDWLPHINHSQLKAESGSLYVRRLFLSCRVPYVHPYLFFRLQEMVLGPESPRVPLSERKVVVWYSRSSADASRQNQGREIRNEAAVLAAIRELLVQRGQGERLEVHPPAGGFAKPLDYVRYLNRNAAALLGPHGGGLCNFKWLATNTLVLELMPREWISTPLYEEAIGHGLNYWVDLLDSLDPNHNMQANVTNIIALLKAELGKEPARGPIIRFRYDWAAALKDAISHDTSRLAYFSSLDGKCCNHPAGHPGNEGLYVLPGPR